MNKIKRRGFISSLFASLAAIPFVGKLFADEDLSKGAIPVSEFKPASVGIVEHYHINEDGDCVRSDEPRGSGSDGENCFSGEWFSVAERLPTMEEHSLSFSHGKVSLSDKVLAVREKGSTVFAILRQESGEPSPRFFLYPSGGGRIDQEISVLYWTYIPKNPITQNMT